MKQTSLLRRSGNRSGCLAVAAFDLLILEILPDLLVLEILPAHKHEHNGFCDARPSQQQLS